MLKVFEYLLQDRAIRAMTVFVVISAYSMRSISHHYREKYKQLSEQVEVLTDTGQQERRADHPVEQVSPGFPAKNFVPYQIVSSIYMLYIVIRELTPITSLMGPEGHCYLNGELYLLGRLIAGYSAFYASQHLIFRIIRLYFTQAIRLDLVAFLMQSNEDVERIYRLHNSNATLLLDRYLESIMCYEVKYNQKVAHRLRPNRTREARDKLNRITAIWIGIIILAFAFGFVAVVPYVAYRVYIEYDLNYPMCSESLGRLRFERLGLSLNIHWFVSYSFDSLENIFIWVDSLVSVYFSSFLVILLTIDIHVYCDYLEHRMKTKLHDYKSLRTHQGNQVLVYSANFVVANIQSRSVKSRRDSTSELINMLGDFFNQIELLNPFVSAYISFGLVIYCGSVALFTYSYLIQPVRPPFWVRSDDVIMLTMFSTAFFNLLYVFSLQAKTRRLYPLICSLMAREKSSNRIKYIRILDYYRYGIKATYSFLYIYSATPSNGFIFFSWALTCHKIVENLYRDYVLN